MRFSPIRSKFAVNRLRLTLFLNTSHIFILEKFPVVTSEKKCIINNVNSWQLALFRLCVRTRFNRYIIRTLHIKPGF